LNSLIKFLPEMIDSQNFIKRYAIILIAIVGILAYANSFNNSFQFDDGFHIVDGTKIKKMENVLKFSHWKGIGNRPFSFFTLAIDYKLADKNEAGRPDVTVFHIFNLIYHILAGFIAFLLCLEILSLAVFKKNKIIQDHKVLIALFTAFIFIAHPIQTQAVTYIIQRMTVLAGLFYMWSILLYIRGRNVHLKNQTDKRWVPYAFYAGAVLTGVLGFLSKQNAITFPVAFILVEALFIRNQEEKIDRRFLGLLSGFVGLFIVLGIIIQGLPVEYQRISRLEYLYTQFRVLVKYWQLLFLPINQHLDYYFTVSLSLWGVKELLSLAFILLTLALGVWLFLKKWFVPAFAIFWFYLTLSLESSIIPIRDVIFEHRLYMAVFGFGFAIAYLAFYFAGAKKTRLPIIALSLLTIVYIGASLNRNRVWENPLTLWSDSVKKSPERERSWYWLATYYSEQKDHENAMECFNTSIKNNPGFSLAFNGRGNLKKEIGDLEGALKDYDMAIQIDPKYITAYYNRGVAYAAKGDLAEAIEDYDKSVELGNKSAAVYYNRGNAKRRKKMYDAAITDYNTSISLDPKNPLCYFNRGLTKAALDQNEDAITDIDRAIKIDPRNHLFYNGKGVSQISLKRWDEALANFDSTIKLNPDFGQAYYNRAYAKFFGKNDQAGACKDWQTALSRGYKAAQSYLNQNCK
jgi:tetratricopeptide (TPR) repeat protein